MGGEKGGPPFSPLFPLPSSQPSYNTKRREPHFLILQYDIYPRWSRGSSSDQEKQAFAAPFLRTQLTAHGSPMMYGEKDLWWGQSGNARDQPQPNLEFYCCCGGCCYLLRFNLPSSRKRLRLYKIARKCNYFFRLFLETLANVKKAPHISKSCVGHMAKSVLNLSLKQPVWEVFLVKIKIFAQKLFAYLIQISLVSDS